MSTSSGPIRGCARWSSTSPTTSSQKLPRGGHDYRKLYAAYKTAIEHEGAPTVILAKTVKGWTLGADFEARNATHQIKKMTVNELKSFRDRLYLEVPDEALESGDPPYYHPGFRSPEYEYLMERRRALAGFLPDRVERSKTIVFPRDEVIDQLTAGTGEKVQASTTTAFTRLLRVLLKDPEFGPRVVPIIPDEARTFGMDALFAEFKIYSPLGQRYEPVDAALMLSYREADQRPAARGGHHGVGRDGVVRGGVHCVLHLGLPAHPVLHLLFDVRVPAGRRPDLGLRRPAGQGVSARRDRRPHHAHRRRARSTATGSRCTTRWRSRTAAPTTRRSRTRSACSSATGSAACTAPAARTARTKTASITSRSTTRTTCSRRCPKVSKRGSCAASTGTAPRPSRARTARRSSRAGRWCCTRSRRRRCSPSTTTSRPTCGACPAGSSSATTRSTPSAGTACTRRSRPAIPYVTEQLRDTEGPILAVTDWVKSVPDSIARFVPQPYVVLGTDGYGFSDTRAALRRHFEIDAAHIAVGVLQGLAQTGDVKGEAVADAIRRYEIDPDGSDPRHA